MAEEVISRSIIHEAYFNLWGHSLGWAARVMQEVDDAYVMGSDDVAEYYHAPMCNVLGTKFQSTDKARVDALCRRVNSLLALAQKHYSDNPDYEITSIPDGMFCLVG